MDPRQLDELSNQIYAAVTKYIPAYQRPADPDFERDFRASNRLTAEVLWDSLLHGKAPAQADLEQLAQFARRRVHQGVPLTNILRSYRIGSQIVLAAALATLPATQHASVATKVLEATEQVSTLVTTAYVEEQQQAAQSLRQSRSDALTRLMVAASDPDHEPEPSNDFGLLGVGPNTYAWTFVIGVRPASTVAVGEVTHDMWAVQTRLERTYPQAVAGLVSKRLVCLLSEESIRPPYDTPLSVMSDPLPPTLVCGMSGPALGRNYQELRRIAREATRAYELGPLLAPNRSLFLYDDVALLDVFREGREIEHFINLTLAPLLALPARRREELLACLSALFANGLNQKAAAYRLRVHENTVAKRLRVAEDTLGTRLDGGYSSLRLQLALWLHDSLQRPPF